MPRILLILVAVLIAATHARTITDMAGRTLDIDANLTKVFGSAPPTTALVALFKPEALIALNLPLDNAGNRGSGVLPAVLRTKPILKGWHGTASGTGPETLLEAGTQAIIGWNNPFLNQTIEQTLHGVNIPIIYIEPDDMRKLPSTFRFLGTLFDMAPRGEALAAYAERVNASLTAFRRSIRQPKTVYYALGPKGLYSECDDSFHATFIEAAGGVNVNHCAQGSLVGMETVSLEHLLLKQPDAIFVQDATLFKTMSSNPQWKLLKAVQNGAVHFIPKTPINWLDRPPSFMRLLGAQWVAATLYPEQYSGDIAAQTREFFDLFFGVGLAHPETVMRP